MASCDPELCRYQTWNEMRSTALKLDVLAPGTVEFMPRSCTTFAPGRSLRVTRAAGRGSEACPYTCQEYLKLVPVCTWV